MNQWALRRSCRLWNRRLSCLYPPRDSLQGISTTAQRCSSLNQSQDGKTTRNIGIIAHIDAGKTTTTERMLYYSGTTRRIGDVDDGSTVTDFLPAERARGITIQSAAVTFHWPPLAESHSVNNGPRSQTPHSINLIDTPGHADFTFEVLRSLRILDGAICILDGVAGVEAQTEKVWTQANNYKIPRIVFVNKLDRDGASFKKTILEIGSRLRGWPVLCQIPWWEGGKGRFTGVADVINLCALKWSNGGDGKSIQRFSLEELSLEEPGLRDELIEARSALIESLCEFDEKLLETWLEYDDDSLAIPTSAIIASLRRCVQDGSGRVIPVFAGASFRNIGVQPLLDAINDLLPSPLERPEPEISIGNATGSLADLLQNKLAIIPPNSRQIAKRAVKPTALVANIDACALAFKVVNDPRRGVLVYIRVYSGVIQRNAALWNTNLHVTERAQRLLQMFASDAVEIQSIAAGQIGVIAGLKHARTGDTLISYAGVNPKTGPPAPLNSLQLRPIEVPTPVFFAAIEPHSLAEEKNVADILSLLLREDPSLQVSIDEESGQTLLSGMGELHLEIARDRLVKDFKAKASMGDIEISYRECVLGSTKTHRALFDREVAGKKGKAACEAFIEHIDTASIDPDIALSRDGNHISIDIPMPLNEDPDVDLSASLGISIPTIYNSLANGAAAALSRGPRRAFPLHDAHVKIKFDPLSDMFAADTTPAAISSVARLVVQTALKEALDNSNIGLMEPVMNVVISCDESSLGAIVHDLSAARGGQVLSLENTGDDLSIENELESIDPTKIYAPPDPFASSTGTSSPGLGQQRQIIARVPLKEMIGYLKHLRSLTGGRGTFIMSVDRFERLSGPREKAI